MLLIVPEFLIVFGKQAGGLLFNQEPLKVYDDFNCQMAKLVEGMCSGEYSRPNSTDNGIRPKIFRRVVGRGHPEFSTAKQQDAEVEKK